MICEYCKKEIPEKDVYRKQLTFNTDLKTKIFGMRETNYVAYLLIDKNNNLCFDIGNSMDYVTLAEVKINYCPMCGKKL